MAKDNRTRFPPKRGAFPTPRSVLEGATPYEPGQSKSESNAPEGSGRSTSSISTGELTMSNESGSTGYVGTAGTPPPPSGGTIAGSQAGSSTKGTAGTPPPPSGGATAGSQAGAGNVGTAGTPPPPSGGTTAGSKAGAGYLGTPGTPPPK